MAKSPIEKAHDRAWKWFSLYIRRRDKGVCISCGAKGKPENTDAGHYYHRHPLDFNEKNINGQCARCNFYLKGNPIGYALGLEKKYGYNILQELAKELAKNKKYTYSELEMIAEEFKGKCERNGLVGGKTPNKPKKP